MSILVDGHTKVICQGMGKAGTFHATRCREYGTQLAGGVHPNKGGTRVEDIPIFETCRQATAATGATASMIFVPAPAAADAAMEAADAGIEVIVLITEGIPTADMIRLRKYLDDGGVRLIGPNCPGIITPGEDGSGCKIGIMPGYIHLPPRKGQAAVGIISRSGTLTYEAVWQCSTRKIAQSTCVGIGGDPVKGLNFIELLEMFQNDPQTDAIVMIGEIGGTDEENAAAYIAEHVNKPVVAFIAGRTAPADKRMGHAGAIISGGTGTAEAKISALRGAGITVAESPALIGQTLADRLI